MGCIIIVTIMLCYFLTFTPTFPHPPTSVSEPERNQDLVYIYLVYLVYMWGLYLGYDARHLLTN